jgi:SecD-like export protein/SecD/SecF GG-like protein
MNSQLRWKFILILIVVLVCVVSITGFPKSLGQLKSNASSAINLGLDLRGGSHLVLQVSVNEAIQQRCDETIDDLRKQIHTRSINVGDSGCADATHIVVKNVDGNSLAAFRDLVGTSFPDWTLAAAAGEVNGFELTLKPTVVADLQHNTMEQSIETIQRRVNELGLTEPTVAPTGRGADEILVELPAKATPLARKPSSRPAASSNSSASLTTIPILRKPPRSRHTAACSPPARKSFPAAPVLQPLKMSLTSITFSIAFPSSPAPISVAPPLPLVRITLGNIRWISRFPRPPLRGSVRSLKRISAITWLSSSIIASIRRP